MARPSSAVVPRLCHRPGRLHCVQRGPSLIASQGVTPGAFDARLRWRRTPTMQTVPPVACMRWNRRVSRPLFAALICRPARTILILEAL
jgi:hypothetical protein